MRITAGGKVLKVMREAAETSITISSIKVTGGRKESLKGVR